MKKYTAKIQAPATPEMLQQLVERAKQEGFVKVSGVGSQGEFLRHIVELYLNGELVRKEQNDE